MTGGRGTPSARAGGCSPSPGPHPLPQRAFFGRMQRRGSAAVFPVATVPRNSKTEKKKAAFNAAFFFSVFVFCILKNLSAADNVQKVSHI